MSDIVKQDNVAKYTASEIQLVHDTYAKGTTKEEFELYLYTANKFGLDPLLKQIWCVKFAGQNAQIYAGRDGFLEIAHRSGQFNGIKSGMKDKTTAYAEVYRKDMTNPFYVEVDMAEYSTGKALWGSKPKTMLVKVAESQALRRAFSISGIYEESEMSQWELQAQGIKFEPEPVKQIVSAPVSNTTTNVVSDDNNYGLDPMTYKLTGGKFAGKLLIDCDTAYITWMIGKAKESTYPMTYDKVPMDIWISFLDVCLTIHTDRKNAPVTSEPEPEFIDVESVSQDELKADYDKTLEHFEDTFDAHEVGKGKEYADKLMANLKGK